MLRLLPLAFVVALPAAAIAQAAPGPGVAALAQGIFCAPPEAERREAPGTESGWMHVPDQPIEMVAESEIAPMVLGMGFGVLYQLHGEGPVTISHVVTHPPMGDRAVTRQAWDKDTFAGLAQSSYFQFDEAYEMVPGAWAFEAWLGDERLFSAGFTVVPAEEAPELASLCRGGALFALDR